MHSFPFQPDQPYVADVGLLSTQHAQPPFPSEPSAQSKPVTESPPQLTHDCFGWKHQIHSAQLMSSKKNPMIPGCYHNRACALKLQHPSANTRSARLRKAEQKERLWRGCSINPHHRCPLQMMTAFFLDHNLILVVWVTVLASS